MAELKHLPLEGIRRIRRPEDATDLMYNRMSGNGSQTSNASEEDNVDLITLRHGAISVTVRRLRGSRAELTLLWLGFDLPCASSLQQTHSASFAYRHQSLRTSSGSHLHDHCYTSSAYVHLGRGWSVELEI